MDDKIAGDIAAALWQIESQLQSLNNQLEKLTGVDEFEFGDGRIHRTRFLRTHDIGKSEA